MKFFVTLFFFFGHLTSLFSESPFGYISYTSYNIGDDIQAIAAKKLLSGNVVPIDREFIGVFEYPMHLPTLVNGWFMHTKETWCHLNVPAPNKSWPPSPCIDPLIISFHINEIFLPYAFTDEGSAYLKAHAPIGARDLNTLKELQAREIPSYFSGCLTLTLDNESEEREDIIYAVDLDKECYHSLKLKTNSPIVRITHILNGKSAFDPEIRADIAHSLLEKYKRAKAVVTTRLHAAMPCLAFNTPVLLINERSDKRLHGLRELTHTCTRAEFLKGQFNFDFESPNPNPKDYLNLRQNLLDLINHWRDLKVGH